MSGESAKLLADYVSGCDKAAAEIIDRYTRRLVGLARSRLAEGLKRRVDPEDVVQSAYRSFFRRAKDGEFTLKRSGDLWRLLAGITLCKALKRVERETAQKRDFRMEKNSPNQSAGPDFLASTVFDTEPTPEQATILVEELLAVVQSLSERDQQILEGRLRDESVESIAAEVKASESTVRRVLRAAKEELERRLFDKI